MINKDENGVPQPHGILIALKESESASHTAEGKKYVRHERLQTYQTSQKIQVT